MRDTLSKQMTTDDSAWISAELSNHYSAIKKSEFLTDEEKNREIGILTQRAIRFGLLELVDRFGYLVIDITLERNRWAQLIIPKDIKQLEMLRDGQSAQESDAGER
jgi:hypothetical protein